MAAVMRAGEGVYCTASGLARARIVLADDHSMFRQGIRALLERHEFQVVGESADGRGALALAARLRPDIAVLDIAMPLLDGFSAARQIRAAHPATQVILLSAWADDGYAFEAHRAGARGYVSKVQAVSDLVDVIRRALRRSAHSGSEIFRSGTRSWRSRTLPESEPLTGRERQVLLLIAQGKTTRETATILGISMKTADSHRSRIMRKLEVHETASLVRYAVRRGIVCA